MQFLVFWQKKVMCICYVDDLIFWAQKQSDINKISNKLINVVVELEEEDHAADFLGIFMEHDEESGLLELKQTGLIDWETEALGLDIETAKKWMPSEVVPLVKDMDCKSYLGDFRYSNVVGMQLTMQPDICFVLNNQMRWHQKDCMVHEGDKGKWFSIKSIQKPED